MERSESGYQLRSRGEPEIVRVDLRIGSYREMPVEQQRPDQHGRYRADVRPEWAPVEQQHQQHAKRLIGDVEMRETADQHQGSE